MKYPVGIQSFEKIRSEHYLYVDKTQYIYQLTRKSDCFFLSRPRRFGKSLLLSTLESFFEGKKHLFEGLKIYDLEKDWKSFPIIHIDFGALEASSTTKLEAFLSEILQKYSIQYAVPLIDSAAGLGHMFGRLIEGIAEKTASKVVVLIDEYDKGVTDVLANTKQLSANQEILRPFFSQLKIQDKHIRFSMLTGVARFRHMTLFSGFNNPNDISLNPDYASICGISQTELQEYFTEGLQTLEKETGKDKAAVIDDLRLKYDSYRFSRTSDTVYNPFSLVNCFENRQIGNYWLKTGTSKVFYDFLTKSNFDITDFEQLWATDEIMEGVYSEDNPTALLYQTGYLTITDFNDGLYKLGIPNGEVRTALVNDLIPNYMGVSENSFSLTLSQVRHALSNGNVESMLILLQSLTSKIPYHELDLENLEKTYHLVVYQLFLLIGIDAHSEIAIAGGRIDMVAQTPKYVYVFEFKLGGTPEEALNQIEKKGYALPWSADKRKVHKIGVVFSPTTRTLSDWKIQ